MLNRLNYSLVLLLTVPFLIVAVFVALAELAMGLDGHIALLIANPFIWALERRVNRKPKEI